MTTTDRKRFNRAISHALDSLQRDAKCYGYALTSEYRELTVYLQNMQQELLEANRQEEARLKE